MVNTPAEEGGAGCSHGRVKININWRSSFTRQLVNRVPHPIFCSVCVSCFIKFGRLRVSCVPPSPSPGGRPRGWCHPGPHWKPIRPPTAEQFHLQLSPFCRLEIGRSISPPRTHTKALRLPSFSLVGSSRPQDERDCHPTCRIWSSTRRVMEIFLLQFHVCSDNWTTRCQLVCHSLTRILQKLSWSSD